MPSGGNCFAFDVFMPRLDATKCGYGSVCSGLAGGLPSVSAFALLLAALSANLRGLLGLRDSGGRLVDIIQDLAHKLYDQL